MKEEIARILRTQSLHSIRRGGGEGHDSGVVLSSEALGNSHPLRIASDILRCQHKVVVLEECGVVAAYKHKCYNGHKDSINLTHITYYL